jgi:hypothetical protein
LEILLISFVSETFIQAKLFSMVSSMLKHRIQHRKNGFTYLSHVNNISVNFANSSSTTTNLWRRVETRSVDCPTNPLAEVVCSSMAACGELAAHEELIVLHLGCHDRSTEQGWSMQLFGVVRWLQQLEE